MKEITKTTIGVLEINDVKQIVAILNDPEVSQFSSITFPFNENMADDMIKKSVISNTSSEIYLGIYRKDGGEIVGIIALKEINQRFQRAEVGIWLGKKYWGCGYAKEAIGNLVRLAFGSLNLEKLYADIREPNIASLNLFQKAGFALEGRLKKHVCYNGERLDIFKMGLTKQDISYQNRA
jgi:RimJ/RimL family protein N-acetyltransferase